MFLGTLEIKGNATKTAFIFFSFSLVRAPVFFNDSRIFLIDDFKDLTSSALLGSATWPGDKRGVS